MRYFIELSYDGTDYHGWQSQPNSRTVQETIERAINIQWQPDNPIEIVGCGRTDTGVHANHFFAHFDTDEMIASDADYHLNRFLPDDIAIHNIFPVGGQFHARFDAISRTYIYRIHTQKQVFNRFYSTYFPFLSTTHLAKLNEIAELLKEYREFKPFSKTNTDVKTYKCVIQACQWQWIDESEELIFTIKADRFLRGMIRLIVGTSINIVKDKFTIDELRQSLDNQTPLPYPYSAPAKGLTLSEIEYPKFK